MPPGRRTNTPQATAGGILADPAIISSSLARKASPATAVDQAPTTVKNLPAPKDDAVPTTTTATTTDVKAVATPEPKLTPQTASKSASRNASPQTRAGVTPVNATATVEQDVVTAFKGFAQQQRHQADKIRSNKAKADKETKLQELKRFASSFTLNSPVPSDLVSIIAKDPAKQREIQEKALRNAEIAVQAKVAKDNSSEVEKATSPTTDPKTAQRPAAVPSNSANATTGVPSRMNTSRTPNFAPQGPFNPQFRGQNQAQPSTARQPPPQGSLGQRLRSLEQSKNGQIPPLPPNHDLRHPPTGPAHGMDPNFSRRSSGAISMTGAKLNPNSNEFRPNAPTFTPSTSRSTGSSPRSNSTVAPNPSGPAQTGTLVRRKPVQVQEQEKSSQELLLNIIETVAGIKAQPNQDKKWEAINGGFKPAFDTIPTWKQLSDKEPDNSIMHLTYIKVFENALNGNQTMSPPQPSHVNPQGAHQHQLPFHLQNASQRQSPRQPPMHMHNQHNHGPNTPYNADDHRMMSSHSAQSFASPRMQQVNMAYHSPMGQPAQLAYNQQGMQYPMGPGGPQMPQYRSYSGNHQFVPQQASHMGGPVMIPAPAGNGFMGPGAMVPSAPQMIYPGGQPHFVPQGNGPPPMPGANGYPSPGRTAPMMMNQGSQQGQSVYGMSPGIQYGQPIYGQQPPGQSK
jgi:hypothetical protein